MALPQSQTAAALQALQLNWSLLGSHRLRVTPSKTAIVPVKSDFLPRTKEERALCARTVYVANIDKKVDKEDVLAYFEKICGEDPKIAVAPARAASILICGPLQCINAITAQMVLLSCTTLMMYRLVGKYLVSSMSQSLGTASKLSVLRNTDTHVQDMSQSAACFLTTTAPQALLLWSLPSMRAPRMPWTAAGLSWAQCPSVSRHPRHLFVMKPEIKSDLNDIVSICDGNCLPGVCLQRQHSR